MFWPYFCNKNRPFKNNKLTSFKWPEVGSHTETSQCLHTQEQNVGEEQVNLTLWPSLGNRVSEARWGSAVHWCWGDKWAGRLWPAVWPEGVSAPAPCYAGGSPLASKDLSPSCAQESSKG